MKTATKIIFDFIRTQHPLSRGIEKEETPLLVGLLRKRLSLSEIELDFSPISLQRLEDKLSDSADTLKAKLIKEEEIIQIIREIAAYVGEVLVLNTNGKWQNLGDLWSTKVIFEGNIKITKAGNERTAQSIAFSLGNIGAGAWDMISLGRKPILYCDYLSAKKKTIIENFE